jgi:FkbH-like protein
MLGFLRSKPKFKVRDEAEEVKAAAGEVATTAEISLHRPIKAQDIEDLFQLVLKRRPEDDKWVSEIVASGVLVSDFIKGLADCDELKGRLHADVERARKTKTVGEKFSVVDYRAPRNLRVSGDGIKQILMVASCLGEAWKNEIRHFDPAIEIELHLSGAIANEPLQPIENYNFQIVQIPLRSVLQGFSLSGLKQADIEGHERLFNRCKDALAYHLKRSMTWNETHGLLTFVTSFMAPQQNPIGRLLPNHSLTNPRYFILKLNEYLENLVQCHHNAHYFDINEVGESLGKRFSYEDHFAIYDHGGVLGDHDFHSSRERLEPIKPIAELYDYNPAELLWASWREICAMYRTIKQIDSVKMVVVDLDDTMWRGVAAEATDLDSYPDQDGWPVGLWDALLILKRRGVLLAINSQNEESLIRQAWPKIVMASALSLDDFAVRKINWAPKSENLRDILNATKILAKNVVYIDDNPLHREEVSAAFPQVRTLGGTPGVWRHVLLWAPETQVANVSKESGARTEMIQAQLKRDEERERYSPEAFLGSLQLKLDMFPVEGLGHPRYKRMIELVNKTNQFNTTGRRWSDEACLAGWDRGLRIFAFQAADRFTNYGLVGVVFIEDGVMTQFVMSCRVMGLDIEIAVVRAIANMLGREGRHSASGVMQETERNAPCRSLFERAGFVPRDGKWVMNLTRSQPLPAHIEMAA